MQCASCRLNHTQPRGNGCMAMLHTCCSHAYNCSRCAAQLLHTMTAKGVKMHPPQKSQLTWWGWAYQPNDVETCSRRPC